MPGAESDISKEAYNHDFSYEQELLNLDSGIAGRKAEFSRYQGFDFAENRIQRENAISLNQTPFKFII